jgi:hypothetical protein
MGQRQSQTNAPLFYAQRLMSLYEKDRQTLIQQDQHALLTSAWLCLRESWVCWLNELSTYMNLDRAEAYQVDDVTVLLDSGLPEGQLLLSLIENSDSWLSTMLERALKPTERLHARVKSTASSIELIALVPTDNLDEDQLMNQILSEFKKYIESVRVRQVEW